MGGVISSTSSSHNRNQHRRGRHSNGTFAFAFGHPLRLSHRQVIRSKQHVPVPIPSPPRMPEFEMPPPLPVGSKKTLAKRAAAYFVTLFRPWSKTALPNLSYSSWAEWVCQLQSTGTVLSLFRLAVMTRMSQGFAESADSAKVNALYRLRNCRFWNSLVADGTAPPPGLHAPGAVDGAEGGDDNVAAEAAAAIGELIRQAQGAESPAKEAAKLRSAQKSECTIEAVLRSYCQATAGSDMRAHARVPVTATAVHITRVNHDWMVEDDAADAQLPPEVGAAEQQPGPHVWPDDTHLSASQRTAVEAIRQFLPGTAAPPTPFLVLGGPGTGKTFVARYLAECCGQLGVRARSAALAAAAAGLLPGGCTLHTLIGLGGRGKAAEGSEGGGSGIPVDFSKPISNDKLRALRKKFSNVRLLIIDEISMVPVNLLGHVNHRLQIIKGNTELFGGLLVVLMGDFDQLPPCTDPGLAAMLMHAVLSGDPVPAVSAAASALSCFRACTTFFLTEQHRCADAAWKKILDDCRSSGSLAPIAGQLRQLSAGDCIADQRWRSATVATFGNRVRQVRCNRGLSLIPPCLTLFSEHQR
jgi:hypothetical protein